MIELSQYTKIEISYSLYPPNKEVENGKRHAAIKNMIFIQIRVRSKCLM